MTRHDALVIASLSLGVRALLAVMFGVRDGADTIRYVEAADLWSATGWSVATLLRESERSPLFVAVVGFFKALFSQWQVALVVVQTLLGALVPLAIWAAARGGGVSRRGAWAAALMTIASYELSRWNAYVLTDALFVDFSAATLGLTIVALSTRRLAWAVAAGVALASALFARPTGPAVALAVVGAACSIRPIARKVLFAAVVAIVIFTASTLSIRPEVRRGPPLTVWTHLVEGRVVWGSEAFRVQPPPALVANGNPSSVSVTRMALEYPGHLGRVLLRRAIVYWLPFYPNYSRAHNAANVLLLALPMALAVAALVRGRSSFRTDVVRLVCGCFLAGFGIFHTLTWSEGDHRFLAPVLPAIYLLAGVAFCRVTASAAAALHAPNRTA